MHLLLDTIEIKWGNGVHLFAPLSWDMLQLNLLWPEHPIMSFGSIAGLCYLMAMWKKTIDQDNFLVFPPWQRSAGIIFCLLLYIVSPLYFITDVEKANNGYIHTLMDIPARPGKDIEFDRIPYSKETQSVTMFTGEKIDLQGNVPEKSGLISFKGTFSTEGAIIAKTFHVHNSHRDISSYLGMLLYFFLFSKALLKAKKTKVHAVY